MTTTDIRAMVAEYLAIPVQFGDEWMILCPHPEHVDHRPSASIYVGEPQVRLRNGKAALRLPGMWVCYSCHRAGRISNDAIENYTPSTDRNLEVIDLELEDLDHERRIYPESWLALYETPQVHPYWLSRFLPETCRRHRLGYDFERDAGTYPYRDPAGRLLGVVHRSFDTEATGWKYRYPKGIDKSQLLYGYAEAVASEVPTIVIGEGALDAVAVDEAGSCGLAIYGSRLSEAQAHLINRLNPATIIWAFDNDSAGRDALAHAQTLAIECFDQRAIDWPAGVKDMGDVSVTERASLLANALLI